MSKKIYYMVLYENGRPTGVNFAMPSVLDEVDSNKMLQPGMPTIERKANGKKYQVTSKRIFNYKGIDGSDILFIVCDGDEIIKK